MDLYIKKFLCFLYTHYKYDQVFVKVENKI